MRIEDFHRAAASYKEEGAIVARCVFVHNRSRKTHTGQLVLREVRVVVNGGIGEVRYQAVLPIVGIRRQLDVGVCKSRILCLAIELA